MERYKFYCIFLFMLSKSCFSGELIQLAVESSWPPYSNEKGSGISNDIVKKAFASVDIDVEFIVVPYARALYMAETGKVDGVFNVTKQKSTLEKFNFGEVPILQASASFYFHQSSSMNPLSADDIPTGSSVAVIIGYEYGDTYEKNKVRFNEVRVSNQEQIIQLLQKQRVDLAIMFDEVANYTFAEMGKKPDKIKRGHINHISQIYVAFSKKKKLDRIIKLFDKGLLNIKSSTVGFLEANQDDVIYPKA
ncbi:substrate-binding periplasmic protein [Thalassotalea piscium]